MQSEQVEQAQTGTELVSSQSEVEALAEGSESLKDHLIDQGFIEVESRFSALEAAVLKLASVVREQDSALVSFSKQVNDLKEEVRDLKNPKIIY